MAKKSGQPTDFASCAEATGMSTREIKAAWEDLYRRRFAQGAIPLRVAIDEPTRLVVDDGWREQHRSDTKD